jgi:hypothetical protein
MKLAVRWEGFARRRALRRQAASYGRGGACPVFSKNRRGEELGNVEADDTHGELDEGDGGPNDTAPRKWNDFLFVFCSNL